MVNWCKTKQKTKATLRNHRPDQQCFQLADRKDNRAEAILVITQRRDVGWRQTEGPAQWQADIADIQFPIRGRRQKKKSKNDKIYFFPSSSSKYNSPRTTSSLSVSNAKKKKSLIDTIKWACHEPRTVW